MTQRTCELKRIELATILLRRKKENRMHNDSSQCFQIYSEFSTLFHETTATIVIHHPHTSKLLNLYQKLHYIYSDILIFIILCKYSYPWQCIYLSVHLVSQFSTFLNNIKLISISHKHSNFWYCLLYQIFCTTWTAVVFALFLIFYISIKSKVVYIIRQWIMLQ